MKEIVLDSKRKKAGHYAPGIISRGLLYISGQLPINLNTGELAEGGIEAQARQVFSNLDHILQAAGTTRNSVVQCRVYIPDMRYWEKINELYAEYFGHHRPARVVVPTNELHYGALVEIEAVAEVGDEA
ncbi:RidA family protein [Lachnospiraceae bacterium 45-P1]